MALEREWDLGALQGHLIYKGHQDVRNLGHSLGTLSSRLWWLLPGFSPVWGLEWGSVGPSNMSECF